MNDTSGGEIGIRTLVTLTHPTDFESGPFNRSGISPSLHILAEAGYICKRFRARMNTWIIEKGEK